jgi:hypothetical protein
MVTEVAACRTPADKHPVDTTPPTAVDLARQLRDAGPAAGSGRRPSLVAAVVPATLTLTAEQRGRHRSA